MSTAIQVVIAKGLQVLIKIAFEFKTGHQFRGHKQFTQFLDKLVPKFHNHCEKKRKKFIAIGK